MKIRVALLTLCLGLLLSPAVTVAQDRGGKEQLMSFVFRDVPIAEFFEMLSRKERVSILLSRGVTGNVTVNLYDTTLRQAIHAVAEAAGYTVEERNGTYVVLDGRNSAGSLLPAETELRTFPVQYSDPKLVTEILNKHVTRSGRATLMEGRKMVILQDTPENIVRLERLLRDIDKKPAQIMIEAKILEITLDTSQNFGIDWKRIFDAGRQRTIGTQGLTTRGAPGLFFNVINSNLELYLNALSDKGRVHTLATPKLFTLENHEAVTNIGDKIGYRVTTTINNISTESIQFLETGVILRVTPSVDADGRIAMKIRPEVSSGSVSAGIPSKKTTEVTTQLIAEDGQSILIAGLIKSTDGYRRAGVPVLSDIPTVGGLFSTTENAGLFTETIVVITPRIVKSAPDMAMQPDVEKIEQVERRMENRNKGLRLSLNLLNRPKAEAQPAAPAEAAQWMGHPY